jgi:hypothetical protein
MVTNKKVQQPRKNEFVLKPSSLSSIITVGEIQNTENVVATVISNHVLPRATERNIFETLSEPTGIFHLKPSILSGNS